jgi:vitamin B12 transporter
MKISFGDWFIFFVLSASIVWGAQTDSDTASQSKDNSQGTQQVQDSSKNEKSDKQPEKLDEVVVTATRTEENPDATASSIDVVTQQDIQNQQFRDVNQALKSVDGLETVANGAPGQLTEIFIRGTESNHTEFLMDGRRLQSGLLGDYDITNMTLDNVEQIEVLKGPSSALYGPESIGGVVNIITGRTTDKPFEGSLSFEGGSFSSFREDLQFDGHEKSLDYSFESTRWDSHFERPNNDLELSSFRSNEKYKINDDLQADFVAYYSQSDTGDPGDLRFGATSQNRLLVENWLVSPGITWQTQDFWKQRFFVSFAPQRVHADEPDFGNNDRTQIDQLQLSYQSDFQITEHWSLTAGSEIQDTDVSRNSFAVSNIQNTNTRTSGFLQSQWEILPNWNLINGMRVDTFSDFSDRITWKVGSSYKVPVTTTVFHANVGTAYAPPTPGDLYYPNYANPNLSPEESMGWEAGIKQPLWKDRLTLKSTYFHNDIKNLIQLDASYIPQNLSRATTQGVETSLVFKPIDQVELQFQHTYLDAKDDSTGLRLIRRPRNIYETDVVWRPLETTVLSLGMRYVNGRTDGSSNTPIEDYMTLRAAVSWLVNPHVQIFARGENLTNDQYQETLGYPALDTAVYGGVKLIY